MEEFNDPIRDPQNYRWGVFYVNRKDSRIFVPKRFGIGFTMNFANPYAVVGFVLLLLLIAYQSFWR